MFVAVSGSAALYVKGGTNVPPKDVDVFYSFPIGGDEEEKARQATQLGAEWARAHGLGHLPLDVHQTWGGNVPRPYYAPTAIITLLGDEPGFTNYTGLTSAMRAFGDSHQTLRAELVRLSDGSAPLRLIVWRPTDHVEPEDPWMDYTTGLKALRSAAAKVANFGQFVQNIPLGRFLKRLVEEDPRPAEETVRCLLCRSMLIFCLDFRQGVARLDYRSDHMNESEVLALLYP